MLHDMGMGSLLLVLVWISILDLDLFIFVIFPMLFNDCGNQTESGACDFSSTW
jgi:hypothetical protein